MSGCSYRHTPPGPRHSATGQPPEPGLEMQLTAPLRRSTPRCLSNLTDVPTPISPPPSSRCDPSPWCVPRCPCSSGVCPGLLCDGSFCATHTPPNSHASDRGLRLRPRIVTNTRVGPLGGPTQVRVRAEKPASTGQAVPTQPVPQGAEHCERAGHRGGSGGGPGWRPLQPHFHPESSSSGLCHVLTMPGRSWVHFIK